MRDSGHSSCQCNTSNLQPYSLDQVRSGVGGRRILALTLEAIPASQAKVLDHLHIVRFSLVDDQENLFYHFPE